jgi:hypothetical protein
MGEAVMADGKKIYIITTGDYSDYSIEGVFDSEEKADRYLEAFPTSDATIEAHEVNPYDEDIQAGYRTYEVVMDRQGGVISARQSNEPSYYAETLMSLDEKRLSSRAFTKSKERAIEIANERRIQMIADGKWEA